MIGIYKIENLINHKVYIGQAIDIKKRWKDHKRMLRNGNHFRSHLQHSWNKYGEENFSFEILEICKLEEMDEKERYWLRYYGGYESTQTYNVRDGGQDTHNVSKETREKLRKANLGKKQSPETIQKRAEKLRGQHRIGRKRTEEERKKQSERQKGKINDAWKNYDRTNPEYRKRLSESLLGKKKSKEHAKHISEGRKGIVFSEEQKRKISLHKKGVSTSLKGRKKMQKDGIVKWVVPELIAQHKQEGWEEYHDFYTGDYVRVSSWNKGIPCSEAQRQNLREKNLGKKLSDETKQKMAEARKNCVWINNGVQNKRINKELAQIYLNSGWQKGRRSK